MLPMLLLVRHQEKMGVGTRCMTLLVNFVHMSVHQAMARSSAIFFLSRASGDNGRAGRAGLPWR